MRREKTTQQTIKVRVRTFMKSSFYKPSISRNDVYRFIFQNQLLLVKICNFMTGQI